MNQSDILREMKEFKKYIRSEENRQICMPYLNECKVILNLVKEYSLKIISEREMHNLQITESIYSTGGESLHRGFFHPSPIMDIVIGNCNRGRLKKRAVYNEHVTHEYCYDKDGIMRLAKVYADNRLACTESLFYEDEVEYGFITEEYNLTTEKGLVTGFSECRYPDNRLSFYQYAIINSFNSSVAELHIEKYYYDDKGLSEADMYSFMPGMPLLNHSKYIFEHDREGELSSYKVQEYIGEVVKPGYWDGHFFQINKKRKV